MSRRDLWDVVYEELSPDHVNIMTRTKFKDVPINKRYADDLIDIDIDGNIILYADSKEHLEFAHRVAEFFKLPYVDRKTALYKAKLDENGRYDFECKINMEGTAKI